MIERLFVRVVAGVMSSIAVGCAKPALPAPRVVDITAADGLVLKATLFSAPAGGPGVILLHQCDDDRKVWDSLGTRLAAAGISALAVDYRGYGESGGMAYDKLPAGELARQQSTVWPTDIDSAFAFLSRQPGVDTARLGAAGGSCGVNNAIQLARRHGNVKALALLAGNTDREGRLFLETPTAPPIFATGAADDRYGNYVEIMSWYFGMSRRPESRFAQYPTGGHAAVMFNTHPGLADTIATWFAAVLANRSKSLPTTNGVPMARETVEGLHAVDQPGGAAAALQRVAASSPSPRLPEYFVNQLGYEHIQMSDFAGAVDLMKLNVALYPDSPNALDSLGDAYLAAGDSAAALAASRKAVAMLERDTVATPQRKSDIRNSAEAKIRQLSKAVR